MAFDDQILLLPRRNYWDWLDVSRRYILAFGPNITPDPGVAARYMAPRQVITFPRFEGAFPEIGDALAWFRTNAEGVRLDPIGADDPAALAKALNRRVKRNDRYDAMRRSFHLVWPTDYVFVTQPFGVNPQIYRRYGMPGHEGVDLRAPSNSNVYAGAAGEVYEVYTDPIHHAYGIHIRIRHEDGYKTVYAHLARALVGKGDRVEAGQLIGRADSTGNSSAAHLHLSLKRDGATARRETNYPKDIIDPTPFLVWPGLSSAKGVPTEASQAPSVGLDLARPGDLAADTEAAVRLGARTVMISLDEPAESLETLRSVLPGVRLVARRLDLLDEEATRPGRFVAAIAGAVGRVVRLGVRDFEIVSFVNERRGGFGWLWRDGASFAEWFAAAVGRLHEIFPEARFGYPCLAPGGDVTGRQQDGLAFFRQSSAGLVAADWIGVACDSSGPNPILDVCLEQVPDKKILVTEVGERWDEADPEGRAIRLSRFVRTLRHPGVDAILFRPDGDEASAGGRKALTWEAMQILVEGSR